MSQEYEKSDGVIEDPPWIFEPDPQGEVAPHTPMDMVEPSTGDAGADAPSSGLMEIVARFPVPLYTPAIFNNVPLNPPTFIANNEPIRKAWPMIPPDDRGYVRW